MKKIRSLFLCFLVLLALSVPALAEEDEAPPDWLLSEEDKEALAAAEESEEAGKTEESLPDTPDESAGTKDDDIASGDRVPEPVEDSPDDEYPVGSIIDAAGNVWSQSGQLLSPGAAPSDVEAQAVDPEVAEVTLDVLYQALAAVAEDTSEIAGNTGTAYVADLRPQDSPVQAISGLKALVASIFGEYTPITTTSVITQTVGNDTYQYLVETVAPGSAGVDYEWLAGVLLFAILLYCLMRLLGGILK